MTKLIGISFYHALILLKLACEFKQFVFPYRICYYPPRLITAPKDAPHPNSDMYAQLRRDAEHRKKQMASEHAGNIKYRKECLNLRQTAQEKEEKRKIILALSKHTTRLLIIRGFGLDPKGNNIASRVFTHSLHEAELDGLVLNDSFGPDGRREPDGPIKIDLTDVDEYTKLVGGQKITDKRGIQQFGLELLGGLGFQKREDLPYDIPIPLRHPTLEFSAMIEPAHRIIPGRNPLGQYLSRITIDNTRFFPDTTLSTSF